MKFKQAYRGRDLAISSIMFVELSHIQLLSQQACEGTDCVVALIADGSMHVSAAKGV